MLLAIDIGNTSITFGIMRASKVLVTVQLETTLNRVVLRKKLTFILNEINRDFSIKEIVICSVVPDILKIVEKKVKASFSKKALIVGRDIKVPIKNKYRKPKQVGQDRLVCAYAASVLYGKPAIVVDLGTAITLDVVSGRCEYLGGIIVPGIRLSAESLFQKTALLPRISIRRPPDLIGKDTESSILSGIFHGYGAMITGLILELSKKVKGKPKVIVTGGYAELMKKYIHRKIDVIEPHLVFKGISLSSESFPA